MNELNQIIVRRYAAPCGDLLLGSYGDSLCLCDWLSRKRRDRVGNRLRRALGAEFVDGISPVIELAGRRLDEYFAGRRREFDVPLLLAGTDFQKRVWNELLKLTYGRTVSYGEVAKRIGHPDAVRAVANAGGANAVSIFVPCHRVIGSNRSLTGYAGGIAAKEYLLNLEQK